MFSTGLCTGPKRTIKEYRKENCLREITTNNIIANPKPGYTSKAVRNFVIYKKATQTKGESICLMPLNRIFPIL